MSLIEKIPFVGRGQQQSAPAGETDEAKLRPERLGTWFLKEAMEFERSKVDAARSSSKLAWRCVVGMAALLAITVVTSGVVVLNNKPNPPGILEVNRQTGEIRQLKTLADTKIKLDEANDIFNLRRYIEYRESYDWETIQSMFDATMALSTEKEGELYKAFASENNKASPVNVLKDKYRVITKAGTVTFINKIALVSFSKRIVPLNPGEKAPPTEYYQATVAFEYDKNLKLDGSGRGINPAGFQVTSYRVDSDVTKNAAVSAANGGDGGGL
jgi:type IV secretion system protein VirB8